MSKSIKMKDNTYIDTTGITHNRTLLSTLMIATGASGRSKDISSTDANTIRDNGFYYGNGVTNTPTEYGYLFVISHFTASGYCYQVWFHQGTKQVYVREIINGTPNTWAMIYPTTEVVLYDNATGISGTSSATLSETSANFSYLEVFFKNYDGYYNSAKIYSPNGKTISLRCSTANAGVPAIYDRSALMGISGTTITMSNEMQSYPAGGNTVVMAALATAITVVRVVGYR